MVLPEPVFELQEERWVGEVLVVKGTELVEPHRKLFLDVVPVALEDGNWANSMTVSGNQVRVLAGVVASEGWRGSLGRS